MKTPKPKIKESDLQRLILDYLTAKRIFHYRNNSGAMVSEYQGKKRFMRFGLVGSPDIVCISGGRYIGIEVKGTGGKQNDNQLIFQQEMMRAGGLYILAYSLEDVSQWL